MEQMNGMWVYILVVALRDLHPSVFGGRSEGEVPLNDINSGAVAPIPRLLSMREDDTVLGGSYRRFSLARCREATTERPARLR